MEKPTEARMKIPTRTFGSEILVSVLVLPQLYSFSYLYVYVLVCPGIFVVTVHSWFPLLTWGTAG